MPINCISSECASAMSPNIHEILMKLDDVLSATNEQAERICNFLIAQPMAKDEKGPGGAPDMLSHVTDINEKALALHNKIIDISQILGM